jgi:hypothetical protein
MTRNEQKLRAWGINPAHLLELSQHKVEVYVTDRDGACNYERSYIVAMKIKRALGFKSAYCSGLGSWVVRRHATANR